MRPDTAPLAFDIDPGLSFEYVGGDPRLDLVNAAKSTIDDQTAGRLATYGIEITLGSASLLWSLL